MYIHGGGWTAGDKAFRDTGDVQASDFPRWFVDQGFVFVSLNYRLKKNNSGIAASISEMCEDISSALRWLRANIHHYGGDADHIILLGYSSGAHLASLVATDQCYLKQNQVPSHIIKAVICMDVIHFDVPLVLETLKYSDVGLDLQNERIAFLQDIFGKQLADQKKFSPVNHIGPCIEHVHFLMLSAGFHFEQKQSLTYDLNQKFTQLLLSNGITAKHCHFPEKDHLDFIYKFDSLIKHEIQLFLSKL